MSRRGREAPHNVSPTLGARLLPRRWRIFAARALFKDPTSVVLNSIRRHDLSAEWKLAQRATSRAVIAETVVRFTFPIDRV